MADLKAMRDDFAAAFEAGESPNPADWLQRVAEDERQDLERLIDTYLMTAPRRAWDAKAYETSLARVAVEQVLESRNGVSGTWPELLPRLRKRARLKRSELVAGLSRALGLGEAPATIEKVGVFYNGMEHGTLEARGVSQRVLDALAGLVGTTSEALRAAGGSGPPPNAGAATYARMAAPAPTYRAESADRAEDAEDAEDLRLSVPEPMDVEEAGERDLIDELFTGG